MGPLYLSSCRGFTYLVREGGCTPGEDTRPFFCGPVFIKAINCKVSHTHSGVLQEAGRILVKRMGKSLELLWVNHLIFFTFSYPYENGPNVTEFPF